MKTSQYIYIIFILCASNYLSAQHVTKVPLGDILQQNEENFVKTGIEILSQNNRFKVEDFEPSMNYGVYGFYLGLCNFRSGDYGNSVLSFHIAINQLKAKCPKMVRFAYLAYGNASLMASKEHSQVLKVAIEGYQNAADAKLPGGHGGLAIIHSLHNNREEALRNLDAMLAIDQSLQSQSITLFSSLTLGDKDLFLSSLKAIDRKHIKEIPFAMNNIAAGLVRFNLGEKETGFSKEDIIGDLLISDQKRKPYGIIERHINEGKPLEEFSRQERILIPRIDIEYSIGWGPQKCEPEKKGRVDVH